MNVEPVVVEREPSGGQTTGFTNEKNESVMVYAQARGNHSIDFELFREDDLVFSHRITSIEAKKLVEVVSWVCNFPRANPVHTTESCDVPPMGWYCTRKKGHTGPCAAIEMSAVTDEMDTRFLIWKQRALNAEQVCAEAYQVVGSLLSDLDQFNSEDARKILDNLSECKLVHDDVLPWPSFGDKTQEQYAKLGVEMHNITTTVHLPNIPFEDQLACIPTIWQNAVESLKLQVAQQQEFDSEPVEWQANSGAEWRRIDPPKGETIHQRVDYLRSLKGNYGRPAYKIRALYTKSQLVQQSTEDTNDAELMRLTVEYGLTVTQYPLVGDGFVTVGHPPGCYVSEAYNGDAMKATRFAIKKAVDVLYVISLS